MHSLANMAASLLPIRNDRAAASSRATTFDDDEFDPFMWQLDDYDEPTPTPKPCVAMRKSTDTLPNSSTSDMPHTDTKISATLDQQISSGSGVASDGIAGDALSSSPPGKKRRRLRGKSNPPPDLWSFSQTPMSTPRSGSVCTSIASLASTTSTDDSRPDYDLSMGGFQMPVDEWRSQYNRAFTVMRSFFYNSDEHHDVKLLPKGKANGAGGRKAALYKQWGSKSQSEQEQLAELAMKSKQLSEDEKKAVNTRYLLQKKKPARNGQQSHTEKNFFHATSGLFTYHADK